MICRSTHAWTHAAIFTLLSAVLACADDMECPAGTYKDKNVCRRQDSGTMLAEASVIGIAAGGTPGASDGALSGDDAALPRTDAATLQGPEAAPALADAGTLRVDAAAPLDAASVEPIGECDPTRTCGTGYSCVNAKCVSACELTKCDTNAGCSLSGSTPVCICNNGYIAQGAGASLKCVKDVACEELQCHANASCEKGTDQLPHCVCKPGFTGSGMNCVPVTCPALTIANGTVSGGTSYNDTATYKCNSGYELDLFVGNWTRKCGSDKEWSGSAAKCDAVSCGAPPPVAHASVSPMSAGSFESKARYTCDSGYELAGAGEITCTATKSWSSPPVCRPLCGNGRHDPDTEDCDPTATGTNKWECASTCRRQTIYTACFTSSECVGPSEVCHLNRCTKSCASDSGCQAPPVSGLSVRCDLASSGYCMVTGCTRNSDCATGLTCQGTGGDTYCGPCQDSAWCGGKACVTDAEGSPVRLGMTGVCQ